MGITNFDRVQANLFIGPTIPLANPFGEFFFVDGTNGSDNNAGTGPSDAFATIQKAVNEVESGRGDVIVVSPGGYDETVTIAKRNLSIVGMGGRGAAFIEPQTAGAEGMQVTGDDVTLVNLGVAGDATADYALNLNSAARLRAYGCKLEGPNGTIVLVDGTATDQTADMLLRDCEIAWGGSGIVFDNSAFGYPTQIFLDGCRFHNLTTAHIATAAGGAAINLEVTDCVHDNDESGTPPTDYINLAAPSTGIFSGNRFATATNAAAVLTIPAGIMWSANATEAGWSTARPA